MLLTVSGHSVDYSLGSLCHLKANILIFLNKVGRTDRKSILVTLMIKHGPGLLMCMPINLEFLAWCKIKMSLYCGLLSVSVIRSVCCLLCASGFALNFFG